MAPQRGFAVTTIIGLVVIASLAATAGVLIYRYNHAIREAQELREQLEAARKRATDLALLWAGTVERHEAAARQQSKAAEAAFAPLVVRARDRPHAAVVVSADTARLFADSDRAAGIATAPALGDGAAQAAPAVPDPPAGAAVAYDERELAEWKVADDAAYVSVFNKWRACVDTYNDLRLQEQLH